MTKKEKIAFYREKLGELYGEAPCTLDYEDAFRLVVAAQLAAQCTDARVNMVTPALFARFPDAEAFAGADIGELEELIRSTGFYHNKAKNLKKCGQVLCAEYGGVVPARTGIERMGVPTHRELNELREKRYEIV